MHVSGRLCGVGIATYVLCITRVFFLKQCLCVLQIKFSVNCAISKKPNLQRQKKVFTKHKGGYSVLGYCLLENQSKGRNAPSIWSQVVDEKR